jgi:hypothetical protein
MIFCELTSQWVIPFIARLLIPNTNPYNRTVALCGSSTNPFSKDYSFGSIDSKAATKAIPSTYS